MTHELKILPEYFDAVRDGRKRFELRQNDRDFHEGDSLVLREWDQEEGGYTGRSLKAEIPYILYGPCFGLEDGWAILSLAEAKAQEDETPGEEDGGWRVCGTCRHKKADWQGKLYSSFTCGNEESGAYGMAVSYGDKCKMWEAKL